MLSAVAGNYQFDDATKKACAHFSYKRGGRTLWGGFTS